MPDTSQNTLSRRYKLTNRLRSTYHQVDLNVSHQYRIFSQNCQSVTSYSQLSLANVLLMFLICLMDGFNTCKCVYQSNQRWVCACLYLSNVIVIFY